MALSAQCRRPPVTACCASVTHSLLEPITWMAAEGKKAASLCSDGATTGWVASPQLAQVGLEDPPGLGGAQEKPVSPWGQGGRGLQKGES